jgi:hypothetical protein
MVLPRCGGLLGGVGGVTVPVPVLALSLFRLMGNVGVAPNVLMGCVTFMSGSLSEHMHCGLLPRRIIMQGERAFARRLRAVTARCLSIIKSKNGQSVMG